MHDLIINLVFLTSFQFMNLSNLALWVNNRRKWITIIFLNLCDNFPYYMICFFLLSLVFVFIYLCLCVVSIFSYFRQWHNDHLHTVSTFSSSRFLLFFFFFCPHLLALVTDFTVVNSVCTVHTLCIHCLRIKKY